MMNKAVSLLIAVCTVLVVTLPVRGAITIDPDGLGYTDVNPDPATTTLDDDLYIGNTATGEVVVDKGSEVLINYGYLGYQASGIGYLTVDGIDSVWTNRYFLYIGYEGEGILEITNGGQASIDRGYVGNENGSTGTVTVDGIGSTLTFRNHLNIGSQGLGTLDIINSGQVINDLGHVGALNGSMGIVTVNGTGSTWRNNDGLYIGGYYIGQAPPSPGGTGMLDITNGGHVSNGHRGYIGSITSSTGTVSVEGIGSSLTNSGNLYVGYEGNGTLDITDGGVVDVGRTVYVGHFDGAGSIHFQNGTLNARSVVTAISNITGNGIINTEGWIFDKTLTINENFNQIHQEHLNTQDQNIMVNVNLTGYGVFGVGHSGSGSAAIVNGVIFNSDEGYIGLGNSSTGEITVAGIGSRWLNNGSLYVGDLGNGTLDINSGGHVSNTWGNVGYKNGSTGTVSVDGIGSIWTNSEELHIGESGSGMLDITAGGQVSSARGYVGRNSGSMGTVSVNGIGSTWTIGNSLSVGSEGHGRLDITNGGHVSSIRCSVGSISGSTGTVTVDGIGSTMTNSEILHIGSYGNGSLDISLGGLVDVGVITWVSRYAGSGTIHFDSGTLTTGSLACSFNDLFGTGTINTNGLLCDIDLVFDATHGLSQTFNINHHPDQNILLNLNANGSEVMGAGFSGIGTMSISDGHIIESNEGYIGFKSGSMGTVTVRGLGSAWNNNGRNFYIGHQGNGTLNITHAGQVNNSLGYVGFDQESTGFVTVDGAGSTWNNGNVLTIGLSGNGTMDILNGGRVNNTWGYVGKHSGTTGAITVVGTDSIWANSHGLHIGFEGNGTLDIADGGMVSNSTGYIGRLNSSSGAVTVDGAGSAWINSDNYYSDDLFVGHSGNGTLDITNGGMVSNTIGYVGYDSDTTGSVIVTGLGSTWTCNSELYIGYRGHGTLDVTNGGQVNTTHGHIGYESGSTGIVTVEDAGSTWINYRSEYDSISNLIGGYGNGTLHIANGGLVTSNRAAVIGTGNDSTGIVTVDGTDSTWTIRNLVVGGNGKGRLDINNGGYVRSRNGYIGKNSGSTGAVAVNGTGSTWWIKEFDFNVGYDGVGTLSISNGGLVKSSDEVYIGYNSDSIGTVIVDGAGSELSVRDLITVGYHGNGNLHITNGGLVIAELTNKFVTIDFDENGDSFVNMATGGMLALWGDTSDSLGSFLGLVEGTDAIRYWDALVSDWAHISGATLGQDYWLEYLSEGDLAGYTVLTVTAIPEPVGLVLFGLGGLAMMRRKRV